MPITVIKKTAVPITKNQLKPKTIGTKNDNIMPMADPIASAANTTSGFSAAASNRAGKKLPVTKATGANKRTLASGLREL